ncbi:translation initiation factor IF-2 [Salinibacter ruber DSM 13855]|uniref:Translation initiation factor IF-2 n=1 Tax=Salinibacter ruber (strain DSM 13855 / M31) TaxID=309807 RepID=Q2S5D5_SALRD|nr:translation initiation factor IF-2 [Salinibacter ruber DSM 13855]
MSRFRQRRPRRARLVTIRHRALPEGPRRAPETWRPVCGDVRRCSVSLPHSGHDPRPPPNGRPPLGGRCPPDGAVVGGRPVCLRPVPGQRAGRGTLVRERPGDARRGRPAAGNRPAGGVGRVPTGRSRVDGNAGVLAPQRRVLPLRGRVQQPVSRLRRPGCAFRHGAGVRPPVDRRNGPAQTGAAGPSRSMDRRLSGGGGRDTGGTLRGLLAPACRHRPGARAARRDGAAGPPGCGPPPDDGGTGGVVGGIVALATTPVGLRVGHALGRGGRRLHAVPLRRHRRGRGGWPVNHLDAASPLGSHRGRLRPCRRRATAGAAPRFADPMSTDARPTARTEPSRRPGRSLATPPAPAGRAPPPAHR